MNDFFLSFSYAFQGIIHAFWEERNLKIHFVIALIVCLAGLQLKISRSDWLAIILTITLVIVCELINTAMERSVDLVCQKQHHPLAKQAKDCAAGAVLIAAMGSVIVGLIVFIPYIF